MKKMILIVTFFSNCLLGHQSQYEIKPMFGYDVNPKEVVEIRDHYVFGLSVSSNLDNLPFSQLEVGLLQSKNIDYSDRTMKTKITQIFFNGVKDYNINSNLKLYGLMGLGYEELNNEQLNNKSKLFVGYGLGVAYTFANNFSLKIDGKHQFKTNADNSLIYTIGVSIPFENKDKSLLKNKDKPLLVNVPSQLVILLKSKADTVIDTNIFKLEKYVTYLNKVKTAFLVIESHTDSIGTYDENLKLSKRRANNIAQQLISMGMDSNRIKVMAYGERKPITSNILKEGRDLNRRIIIRIENK
jgi:OmpA-OmpF porin, OOP family